jgi:hypothetical protein
MTAGPRIYGEIYLVSSSFMGAQMLRLVNFSAAFRICLHPKCSAIYRHDLSIVSSFLHQNVLSRPEKSSLNVKIQTILQ